MASRSYRIGYNFQRRVKKDLEKQGWFVLTQPKSAFPDMICWKPITQNLYSLMGVECKVNKYLSRAEKEEANKLLSSGYMSQMLVAYRDGNKLIYYKFEPSTK